MAGRKEIRTRWHGKAGRRTGPEVAKAARRQMGKGYRLSMAAGEFVHEEIHHVRSGKHGARGPKQAIAIGLSKARRAGIPVPRRRK